MTSGGKNNRARPCRGGTPVGHLETFTPAEIAAVLYFRMWCSGPSGQAQVREDFRMILGARESVSALDELDALVRALQTHGRRPLMRHHETCRCVGGDEAAFATLVDVAASGEREDAVLIASVLVRADTAFRVADLAEALGSTLRRLTRRLPETFRAEKHASTFGAPAATVH